MIVFIFLSLVRVRLNPMVNENCKRVDLFGFETSPNPIYKHEPKNDLKSKPNPKTKLGLKNTNY